jgi:hypothetical protein
LNAQRKGWAVCPSKSLPARVIEESVLARVKAAQGKTCHGADWEPMDRAQQIETIQGIVERIGYDGAAREISIRFREPASGEAVQG